MFFCGDIVELKVDSIQMLGVVTRTWIDDEDQVALANATTLGIPYIHLVPGQLELSQPVGPRLVVDQINCTLVDRSFLEGDIIKVITAKGNQSGVIISTRKEVTLRRVLSSEPLEGSYNSTEIVSYNRMHKGNHVTVDNWVGIIVATFEMALIDTGSGVRPICSAGGALNVGIAADSLWYDKELGLIPPGSGARRVQAVRQIVCCVDWVCMNQLLDLEQQNNARRPQRYWKDAEIGRLSLIRASGDYLYYSIGDTVVFRDVNSHPPSPTGISVPSHSGQHALYVTSSKTTANVLWQDGTRTETLNNLLELHFDMEDSDLFPGDIGVFSPTNRLAVVQTVNTKKRTLKLRFYGTDEFQEISILDFDPQGNTEFPLGVLRADCVLVSRMDTGGPFPIVPKLGESEVLTGNFPASEFLTKEITTIGLSTIENLSAIHSFPRLGSETSEIEWYGQVSELLLDGRALIKFPSGKTEAIPLSHLYHLDEGLDEDSDDSDSDSDSDNELNAEDDEDFGSVGGWSSDGVVEVGSQPIIDWEGDIEMDDSWAEGEEPEVVAKVEVPVDQDVPEYVNWKRFVILEEPPPDHYYLKEAIEVPPKAYMSRVKKEYDALDSSLPANILVRAYETRTDLLRALIIGPVGTPFSNAPFLFDIFLPPSKFPLEPPKVFFHSWNNSRVSPNLYVEGKICLSLLNTWPGEKVESWSASRSSILQILISIQSLIMVEIPYLTEPGFEKSLETPEGHQSSNLYSERSYVLSRTFVKRACEFPPLGFEEEIKAFYFKGLSTTVPGVLNLIIDEAKRVLVESENSGGQSEEASVIGRPSKILVGQTILTEGACLSLRRTLVSLVDLCVKSFQ